jgi:2-dehydro-3-deoxyphosphogluconate aldolase/(4S)-4-hydroxy-2-oxoglutarate aldolase
MIEAFKKQFVIPVIREQSEANLESICEALADGGLNLLEVTLMSDAAYKVINKLSKKNQLIVGAGTVLNKNDTQKAIDCGARFLVSPGLDVAAVQLARKQQVMFIPGVMTPSEITQALHCGCQTVKVFPVSALGGAQYIKMLSGPFPQMQWMATGGVSESDIATYMKVGAMSVGIGTQLTPSEAIKNKNWHLLRDLAAQHVKAVSAARLK